LGGKLSLGHFLGQTWRSFVSIVLAYGMTVALFVYNGDALQSLIQWNSGFHDWLQHFVGGISARGEALFSLAISDATTFMTLMIFFVRAVVMTLALWVINALRFGVR
jgi:amino acid permease